MTGTSRKIKNWKVPPAIANDRFVYHFNFSPRSFHCLLAMKILRYEDIVIPTIWYASDKSWSEIMYNQPNLGRKAYREIVDFLIGRGLEPIYVEEYDDSMTGGLMR